MWKWLKNAWKVGAYSLGSLLLIAFIMGLAGNFFSGSNPTSSLSLSQTVLEEGDSDQTVAVLHLSGMIVEQVEQSGPFAVSTGIIESMETSKILDDLAAEDSIKAVVLRINSPGGTVVASDELYRAIKDLAAEKTVIASFADTAASGGYYIALGADEIIAHPATLTGSIGVIAQFPELQGLFEQIGVDIRTIKSGEFKDIGSPTREFTDQEREIIQSVVDDSYEQFLDAMIASRNIDENTARELADGRVYSGIQAVENGLVDSTGGFNDATERATDIADLEDPHLVQYKTGGFLDSLLGAIIPWKLHSSGGLQDSGLFYLLQ